jgi:superoxide reductase
MAVKKIGEKYKSNVCGNEVIVTKVGGGTLVCCGKNMKKIEG